jgi:hypothetical protein
MAGQNRRKSGEIVSVCYGINPRSQQVDTVWVKRDGSYSIGAHDYSNQHGNPIEAELSLYHGMTDTICFLISQRDDDNTKAMVAELKAKAAALKAN